MKGLINKSIQDMVEESFGAETWEKVKAGADCGESFFALSLDYPDTTTIALIESAAAVLGMTPAAVQPSQGEP